MGLFEFDEAREKFNAAGAPLADDDLRDVRVNQAIAILNQSAEGRQEEALEILGAVLREDPDHARARYASGLCLLFLGSPDDALPHFAAVAAADPKDPHAAYYHGQCLELAGETEPAFDAYRRASELDPYLRSPFLGMQRTLQKLGRVDEATAALERFKELATNPRGRLIEFKYTRMGEKGEAIVIDDAAPRPQPSGPLFAEAIPLAEAPEGWMWRGGDGDALTGAASGAATASSTITPTATAVDLDGDGRLDFFLTAALVRGEEIRHAVLHQRADGSFTVLIDHPLATIGPVNAALWGDLDSDGLVDLAACTPRGAEVWRQHPLETWTRSWSWPADADVDGAAPQGFRSGVVADLDHDGDLDLLLVAAASAKRGSMRGDDVDAHDAAGDAPDLRLFASVGSSSDTIAFRDLVDEGRLPSGRGARQVVVGDFDGDRDLDIAVLRPAEQGGGSTFLRNDRLWRWEPWGGERDASAVTALDGFVAAAAGDIDGDGTMAVVGVDRSGAGASIRWTPRDGGRLERRGVAFHAAGGEGARTAAEPSGDAARAHGRENGFELIDLVGDGALSAVDPHGVLAPALRPGETVQAWCFAELDPARGAALAALTSSGRTLLLPSGTGRFDFAALDFRGRLDPGQSMRSNASGIGTMVNARVGGTWVTRHALPHASTRGQSLRPVAIGMRGAPKIDFLVLDWSDGVFQGEVGVTPGLHRIVETQRQISSCPIIFAFDGTGHRFISDVLGVGGMGYLVEPGVSAPPRPDERFLLPPDSLAPRDGLFELIMHEPMEEAVYLDHAALVAWDLPPGWSMALDERMGLAEPFPTGEAIFFRRHVPIRRATVEFAVEFAASTDGAARASNRVTLDASAVLAETDWVAAPMAPIDHRFLGRLREETTTTLEFATPLDDAMRSDLGLVADGWVEYPYSQTNFAAWQEGVTYDAPVIEVRDANGDWITLLDRVGYPAGMPRTSTYPLPTLPVGATGLRLRSNLEIHWDRFVLVQREPRPEAIEHLLPLRAAELRHGDYPRRSDGPHRRPIYDADDRTPLADMRTQPGYYTEFGPVDELVVSADDATCIFGPGEEVILHFDAALPVLAEGWTRRFVLISRGWCKDMDLFTAEGERVEPVPGTRDADAEALQERYTTRFGGGR